MGIQWTFAFFVVFFVGLKPSTIYYYRCGDPSIPAMSEIFSFKTMPVSGPRSYPGRIGIVADLGLTYNMTTTVSHLIGNKPDLVLLIGDVTYANLYLTNGTSSDCYSCSFSQTPIHETYQLRWDYWGRWKHIFRSYSFRILVAFPYKFDSWIGFIYLAIQSFFFPFPFVTVDRFMQNLVSKVPIMVVEGNHEIEEQVENQTFVAYSSRFAFPSDESRSSSTFYYSFNAGGIHFIMLGAYVSYNKTGLEGSIAAVILNLL